MDFRETRLCKVISALALFFFTFTYAGGREVAYATSAKDKPAASAPATPKAPKSNAALMDETLSNLRDKLKSDKLTPREAQSIAAAGALDLAHYDAAMREEFKATEKWLKDKKMPEAIMKRHKDFVKHYQDNYEATIANLQNLSLAMLDDAIAMHRKNTVAHLDKAHPSKKRIALDPKKLPHRAVDEKSAPIEEYVPSSNKPVSLTPIQQSYFDIKPIQLALNTYAGQDDTVQLAGLLDGMDSYMQLALVTPVKIDPPTSADLAEAPEVKFTDAIRAKALELKNDPRLIYQYVRNNVEFTPTYGSIQGADYCLQTMKCNAIDTASLLIALLRVSGVHARYAMGTMELPIDKFMNWMGGFTNSTAALDFAATGGMSVTGLRQDGVIKYARMDQVWVIAWIDYMPFRGARHKVGNTWIPLDASYKQYTYTNGMDIAAEVPFDAAGLTNSIMGSATVNEAEGWVTGIDTSIINSAMADYQTRVSSYMTTNHPSATVGDVLGTKTIIPDKMPIMPPTLAYKTNSDFPATRNAKLPDSARHTITFTVTGGDMYSTATPLTKTYNMSDIAGKKVTLSYAPATAEDEAVINSYLPAPHADGSPIDPSELPNSLPAYLINLKPEMRVEGSVVATGGAVTMGTQGQVDMTFHDPFRGDDIVQNVINAGEYWGVAVDVSAVSKGQLEATKARLEATKAKLSSGDYTGITKDDLLGDILYTTAMSYNAEMDMVDAIQARVMKISSLRLPSEAVFKTALSVNSSWGVPVSVSTRGLKMDVDLLTSLTKSFDGNNNNKVQYMMLSGANSSILEHSVPELYFNNGGQDIVEGVSAVKAIQLSSTENIPVYKVTTQNMNIVLPQLTLGAAIIEDIRNAVNAGKEVTVSKSELNFNGTQVCGYIIIDTITGEGAYMIGSGDGGAYIMGVALIAISTLSVSEAEASDGTNDTTEQQSFISLDNALTALGLLGDFLIFTGRASPAFAAVNPMLGYAAAIVGSLVAAVRMYNETDSLNIAIGAFFATLIVLGVEIALVSLTQAGGLMMCGPKCAIGFGIISGLALAWIGSGILDAIYDQMKQGAKK